MCATTSGFASVSSFRWNINFTFLKSQKELARQDTCTKSKGNPLLHSAMALEELGSWKGVDILSKTRKERWPVCRWLPWPWISTWALSLRGRRGSRRSWSWTTFIAISGGQTKTLINPIRTSLFEHIWRPWGGWRSCAPLDILANQAPRRFDGKLGPTLLGAVANWAPADWANLYKVPVPVEFIDWHWTYSVYWRCQYALWARSWKMCILLNICIYSRIFFFYICIF